MARDPYSDMASQRIWGPQAITALFSADTQNAGARIDASIATNVQWAFAFTTLGSITAIKARIGISDPNLTGIAYLQQQRDPVQDGPNGLVVMQELRYLFQGLIGGAGPVNPLFFISPAGSRYMTIELADALGVGDPASSVTVWATRLVR